MPKMPGFPAGRRPPTRPEKGESKKHEAGESASKEKSEHIPMNRGKKYTPKMLRRIRGGDPYE